MAPSSGDSAGVPDSHPHQAPLDGKLTAMQQAIHDAMMEELGIGRKDTLPLEDRGPVVNLAPLPRLQSSDSPWSNFVFDDVDPATAALDTIADGQLYRIRRGTSPGQPLLAAFRGGRQDSQSSIGENHRRGQPSTRGGHGHSPRGGNKYKGGRPLLQEINDHLAFNIHGNNGRNSRNNASRHEAAIAFLRSEPSAMPPQRGKKGGASRAAQSTSETSRRRRAPPQSQTVGNIFNINNSTPEAFMASVNSKARVPTGAAPLPSRDLETRKETKVGKKGTESSGLAKSHSAIPSSNHQPTSSQPGLQQGGQSSMAPPLVPVLPTSSRTMDPLKINTAKKLGGILNSRWNPNPPPVVQPSSSPVLRNMSHVLASVPLPSVSTYEESSPISPSVSEQQTSQNPPSPLVKPVAKATQTMPRHVVLKQMSGIRLQVRGDNKTSDASYRICRDIGSPYLRLQCKKERKEELDINDLITDKTTLHMNIDSSAVVTYCADSDRDSTVWLIMFSQPHEAMSFRLFLLPEGGQNRIPEYPQGKTCSEPEATFNAPFARIQDTKPIDFLGDPIQHAHYRETLPEVLIDIESDEIGATLINFDDELVDGMPAQYPVERSAMMDLASLNIGMLDGIFDAINKYENDRFLEHLMTLTSDVCANSTADEIHNSIEALDAAESLVRQFSRNSQLFSLLNEEEAAAYIEEISPKILERAVAARDLARASANLNKYTIDRLMDLRPNATSPPLLIFDPMTRTEKPRIDHNPVNKPPTSTPQTWQIFAGVDYSNRQGVPEIPDLIHPAFPGVELAKVLAFESNATALDGDERIVPRPTGFLDPDLVAAHHSINMAGGGSDTRFDQSDSNGFDSLNVNRLGLAFRNLAMDAPGMSTLACETPLISTANDCLAQEGETRASFQSSNMLGELIVTTPKGPMSEKPIPSVIPHVKVIEDSHYRGHTRASTPTIVAEATGVPHYESLLSKSNCTLARENARPVQDQLPTTVVNPTPVIIKEESSIAKIAEMEARKQRGTAQLSKSRWATDSTKISPKRESKSLSLMRPEAPLFQRSGNASLSRSKTLPPPAPLLSSITPVYQQQLATVLVVNPHTGLMERVTGIAETSVVNAPFQSAGYMPNISLVPNASAIGYLGSVPVAGPHAVTGYQGSSPESLDLSRQALSPPNKENIRAQVQQRLDESMAAKRSSTENRRPPY